MGLSLTLQTPITSQNLLQVQLFLCRDNHIPATDNRSKKALICCDVLGGGFPWPQTFLQVFISSPRSHITAKHWSGEDQHVPPVARGLKVPATRRYGGYGCDKWVLCHPQCSASLQSSPWEATTVAEEPTIERPHSCKKLGQTQAGPEDRNSHSPHSHCFARIKMSTPNSPAASAGRNGATSASGTSSGCVRRALSQ